MKPNNDKMHRLSYFHGEGEYNYTKEHQTTLTIPTNRQTSGKESLSKDLLSIKTMSYCSRYNSCEAPICPLDILVKKRTYAEGDPECGMARATRHRYWENMPEELKKELPYQGYFQGEFTRLKAARERWESLSEGEKQGVLDRLKNIRDSKKGDGPQ